MEFIPYYKPLIGEEEIREEIKTLQSGWLTTGPKVAKLEELIANYVGAKRAVALTSCSACFHLALEAIGIEAEDEVITTSYTYAPTANMIVNVGAKPVFADIQKDTYNIDPERIEEKINPHTAAIMPMHFCGHPCNMDPIVELARKYDRWLIEDAAQALGSEYKGKRIGTFSHLNCFSFAPTKNITSGEGGMLVTDDEELADFIKLLRLHGIDKDTWVRYSTEGQKVSPKSWYYEIEYSGWKYNMIDMQAAIAIQQFHKLEKFNQIRKEYTEIYNKELADLDVTTPYVSPDVKTNYHIYALLLNSYNREKFIEEMKEKGVGCSVHFIPLHLMPLYQREFGYKRGDLPNTEWVYDREVSLPLYPKMTKDDIYRVIEAVRSILK